MKDTSTRNTASRDAVLVRARDIRLLVLDVDGVMTDGKLYFSESGNESKAFCTLDGQGIKMLQASGVQVAVITGRQSQLLLRRTTALGIQHVIQGREDKIAALTELNQQLEIPLTSIAHLGDDLPDLPIIRRVGLGMAVANAHYFVKQHADWITELRGGEGAVREACELIMDAQGTLKAALEHYL